jgi:hypothetical protein
MTKIETLQRISQSKKFQSLQTQIDATHAHEQG